MTSEVFDKLDPFILFLLPELDMAVLARCEDEIRPEKEENFRV